MPQCWQQELQKPLWGVVRAALCWTQLILVAANNPSQGISEPHSQGGGTAGKLYLGNHILKTFFKILHDSFRRTSEECVYFTYMLFHIALQIARWEKKEGRRCPCSLLIGPHQNRYTAACAQQGMGEVWGENSCREELLQTDLSSHPTLISAVSVVGGRRVRN